MYSASADIQQPHLSSCPAVLLPLTLMASWDLLGIDAYAEDDLGYAPS
jgi:hypothetical protein